MTHHRQSSFLSSSNPRPVFLPLPSRGVLAYSSLVAPYLSQGPQVLSAMATSIYFPPRGNGLAEKSRSANALPTHSSSAIREKWQRHQHSVSWLIPVSLPIPGVRTRRLRLMLPNVARLHHSTIARFGRRKGRILLGIGFLAIILTVVTLASLRDRFVPEERSWSPPYAQQEPSTLVYMREDLQRIWEWEVTSGHYPSAQKSGCPFSPNLLPHRLMGVGSSRNHWPDFSSHQPGIASEKALVHPLAISPPVCDGHCWRWRQARVS